MSAPTPTIDLPSPTGEASAWASPTPAAPAAPAAPPNVETVTIITARGRREERKTSLVRKHDFRQSAFLAPSELRWIKLRHEQFVRALAARLSMCLRMDISVLLSKLQIINYQQLIDGLASPIHISLFKAEPLKGVCLLVIPPRLGLTIVDRLLGGPGLPIETNRELSEIETALLDQTVQIILTEWCTHWQDVQEIKPSLLGHENNCRFLQTAPSDTPMLQITLETGLGEDAEQMQLVFPYYTIEPFVRHMNPLGMHYNEDPDGAKDKWNPELNNIKVNITAEWQGLELTALEISRLKPGDVLLMSPQNANQVQIRLANMPKFCGRLGTCGHKWAVELSGVLQS